MTRNSNALMRDGSVMAHSDLVDFLSGSTDSAINFSGSADLHIPIHPPLRSVYFFQISSPFRGILRRNSEAITAHLIAFGGPRYTNSFTLEVV